MTGFMRIHPWRAALMLSSLMAGVECAFAQLTTRSASGSPAVIRAPRDLKHTNIVFILADDLGYGDLGCYGQKDIRTPSLDRMAAEGMRFTSFYAGSTVCAPSRCSLMTGLHTGHARIRGNSPPPTLLADDVTLAELLQPKGYRSGVLGKWGLATPGSSGEPQKQGFEEWLGQLTNKEAHNHYPEYLYRADPLGNVSTFSLPENTGGKRGQYAHDLYTSAALRFIGINQDRPFFLYLSCTIPHANNELGQLTGNGMEVPSDAPYSDRTWAQPDKNKASMITRMDADVGRVLEKLVECGLDQNTVVFFSSDNGPHAEGGARPEVLHSSGPLRGIKRDLYEGGIRVPLIVRWPGKVKAGSVCNDPWAFWDFLSTACAIAGAEPPKSTDGISFLPTLLGQTQTDRHEFFYWEFHERGFQQAVRMGDWKMVRLATNTPPELYNLKFDLAEKTNVVAENKDVVARIETYLKTARAQP